MSEEIDQELDRILRTGITVAGQVAERVARIRANTDRLQVEREATTRKALEQATREEIGAARRVYGGVHEPTWFNGKEADVQRRFGAALVTAHAMAGVDPVARVAQEHLVREARARYADADGWMQAAVLGYTEAMAELRDRDGEQARADRAENAADALVASDDPDRGREGLEPQSDVASGAEVTARREEAVADRADGRSLDDLDRALDEWSRQLGDRELGDDLSERAHQVGDEAVVQQARAVQEVVEEGFPVLAEIDHARHVGKVRAKTTGGRGGERSRGRTQDRGR
ncbi:hypothetical protein GA0111570_109131 [Raineyella antarctica]|uniref:Uncharacterized protein n=1 Tax=Raineyella antarctica TaxID=1577474 RepID=A0A1G6HGN2_9ACTN|nr:hypothetical protein [Raineyella antarctica]SDB93278.1 hypothetical protein GA0111570_109131 [Raineyella antarctica]